MAELHSIDNFRIHKEVDMAVDVQKASLKTKGQLNLMSLIEDALTKGEGPLKDIFGGFNEQEFQKGVAEPQLKKFKEETLPALLEGLNLKGYSPAGSAFRRGTLKAGTDLQSKLAELMYNAQQQQKQNRIAGVQNQIGQQAFQNIATPQEESIWKTILPSLLQGGATIAGGAIGGPSGAVVGNTLASGALKGAKGSVVVG